MRTPRRPDWSWRREVVELSVLFLAIGTAGLFTEMLGRRHYGWTLLMVLGAALLAASVLHWWWKAHGPGRLRALTPFAAVRSPGTALPAEWPDAALNLWRIRAVVRDTPGSLGAVCQRLAALGVNILGLQVHPLGDGEGVLDEFLVDVPAAVSIEALSEAVSGGGAADPRFDKAATHDLTDAPARALTLAAQLAKGTANLPAVLHDLLGQCTVGWHPGERADSLHQGTTMTLADPGGGTLEITRDAPEFTPSEFARAQALVALCAGLRRAREVE